MSEPLPMADEPERDERCEMCQFWECFFVEGNERLEVVRELGEAAGYCHRFPPPHTIKADSPDSWPDTFPRTRMDDWCGEWQAKDASAKSDDLFRQMQDVLNRGRISPGERLA